MLAHRSIEFGDSSDFVSVCMLPPEMSCLWHANQDNVITFASAPCGNTTTTTKMHISICHPMVFGMVKKH